MLQKNYKGLQNGSDIRGVAISGVTGEDITLTSRAAQDLTYGFVRWLSAKTGKPPEALKISIGRDPRLSGDALLDAAAQVFTGMNVKGFDCGLASTPAMFMSVIFEQLNCDGAVMITASHLPFNRNGFKYFDRDGGLNKGDITEIISLAETADFQTGNGKIEQCNLMDTYCAHLRNLICKSVGGSLPLEGLKIAVDAGNGSGGFYAKKVLAPLGADISASRFLEPDGMFPNHAPNPEDQKALEAIKSTVIESQSDLGIIFDTDVDRSAAVDNGGREIARNGIIALAAALVAEDYPNSTVVTDSITSDQLTDFLENTLNLKHFRFKRGYKNVINKAIELNEQGIECALAIETSGHAAMKENFFLDDGAYLATKIVIKTANLKKEGKDLYSLIAQLKEAKEAIEIRLPITVNDFAGYADKILCDLKNWALQSQGLTIVDPNYEGVRIAFAAEHGDGWCLLRKSLHDPIMPLNVESNLGGGCTQILNRLQTFFHEYKSLDLSTLK